MKTLLILGTVFTTFFAALIATDNSAPQLTESIETEYTEPIEVAIESRGLTYEYPSMEDASIITDVPEDSIVHFILFQEKPEGDVYRIK